MLCFYKEGNLCFIHESCVDACGGGIISVSVHSSEACTSNATSFNNGHVCKNYRLGLLDFVENRY
jgi:hypothetical protein